MFCKKWSFIFVFVLFFLLFSCNDADDITADWDMEFGDSSMDDSDVIAYQPDVDYGPLVCGDGIIHPFGEVCDGDVLCKDLEGGFYESGTAVCFDDCRKLDVSQCERKTDSTLPKPVMKIAFENAWKGGDHRAIVDKIIMNLRHTCVANEETANSSDCLLADVANEKYYFIFKWEMLESPTPNRDVAYGGQYTGNWHEFDLFTTEESRDAKMVFYSQMTTPVMSDNLNPDYNSECATDEVAVCGKEPLRPDTETVDDVWAYTLKKTEYLLCKQKQCFEHISRFYKIAVTVRVVDKESGLASEPVSVDVIPSIVASSRITVQLTWKQGLQNERELGPGEGTIVDLDVHLIKKRSLETGAGLEAYGDIGYMCTYAELSDRDCNSDSCKKHDDCHISDDGFTTDRYISNSWNAQHVLDNIWGGGNYENPETINLLDVDCYATPGSCDLTNNNDDYLVVVTYYSCNDQNRDDEDGDSCLPDGASYSVDAEVAILVDGDAAPRSGTRSGGLADSVQPTSLKFKIKPDQWKVVAEINWNGSSAKRLGSKYQGDALVTDTLATTFPLCTWASAHCFNFLVPVWGTPDNENGVETYRSFVESPPPDETDGTDPIGICE